MRVRWSWVIILGVTLLLHQAQGQGYQENGLQKQGQGQYGETQGQQTGQGGSDEGVKYYGGEDVCGYTSTGSSYRRFMLSPVRTTVWTSTGTCKCQVTATTATTVMIQTQLSVRQIVGASHDINKNIYYDEGACGPMIMLTADKTDYYICAQQTAFQTSTHSMSSTLKPNEPLEFYVYNPDKHPLDSYVRVTGIDPYLSIQCKPAPRRHLSLCPCHQSNMGDMGNYSLALQHRAGLVAGICLLAILILVVIILVIFCIMRKRQAPAEKKELETTKPTTNALRNDNGFKREKSPRVSSNPEPNRISSSRDSGLPNNDKTWENDGEGLNNPSMAGHGSQTSLEDPRYSSAGRTITV